MFKVMRNKKRTAEAILVLFKDGGRDGTRTRGLLRDRQTL